jgi:hypothetical protein
MIQACRLFFAMLLELYTESANKQGIIILENIERGSECAAGIFLDVFNAFPRKDELSAFGTCSPEGSSEQVSSKLVRSDTEYELKKWSRVFPRVIKLKTEGLAKTGVPDMGDDLWELSYTFYLLSRFFPAAFFRELLLEEGENPEMFVFAIRILSALGVIDRADDPQPRIANFANRAETILGLRKEKVRSMVRRRLLAWVTKNRLSPCWALLEILAELGDGKAGTPADDDLMLKSIASDIINGTYSEIEKAIAENKLQKIAGKDRVDSLLYLINTMKALIHGNEGDIRAAFKGSPPECSFSPVLKAQVLANLTAFHLGMRDIKSAMETVKEAILLSQGKNKNGIAQSFRLFALTNLSRHQDRKSVV